MMNRQKVISVFLLLLSVQSLISCNRQTPSEKKAIYIKQVNNLVSTAIQRLGENRSSVQSILGAPSTSSTEQFANHHNPMQTDTIHTLSYNGLIVRIYDVVSIKKEMLLSVRLTENRPGLLPELIGQSDKSIKAKFGDPTRVNGAVFEYVPVYETGGAEEIVKVEFSGPAPRKLCHF